MNSEIPHPPVDAVHQPGAIDMEASDGLLEKLNRKGPLARNRTTKAQSCVMASSGRNGKGSSTDEMASSGRRGNASISSVSSSSSCSMLLLSCAFSVFSAGADSCSVESGTGEMVGGTESIETALLGLGGSGFRSNAESTVKLPRGEVVVRVRDPFDVDVSVICEADGLSD